MDSRYIEHRLYELRDRKSKNAFLETVINNPEVKVIHEVNDHKTIIYPGCKGPKTNTWQQTKKMALELNKAGIDVAFLTELDGVTCADSILRKGKLYWVADFKYCVTTKSNTLAKELEHGFKQACMVVMKPPKIDSGLLKDAINYLIRNEIPYGDIVLINGYGNVLILTYNDLKSGKYARKIKGFL